MDNQEILQQELGKYIRMNRQAIDLKQAKLAERANISSVTI
ncbi:helix-turn-helix domain-containing protein [Aquibacillus albus]|uniref:Transcriptional regulator with XRE-family HTH domain n=1 Tax=Aquibacillus albus TaxID=1168171 RepID=A0ABS2N3M4_9BACI|nr:helix-turn-helix domain-containing protein [Aquibacillus albus]MBM7572684.1 transcriptional regulator with XRE-family HTH domain [Aquibacillus albus]